MPTRRKNKKRNKSKAKKVAKPSCPSYASIIAPTKNIAPSDTDHTSHIPNDDPVCDEPVICRRRCVTNYTPPRTTGIVDCDTWEWAYFQHILDLREIFIEGFLHLCPELDRGLLYSPKFFNIFSDFIFQYSSQYVSPHLEPLSETIKEEYFQYTIKRNRNKE